MSASSAPSLAALGGLRIVFGHQSVGENILEGLRDLSREARVPLTIVTPDDPPPAGPGAVIHARIGRNTEPLSKLETFGPLVDAAAAHGPVDVALLKFCYIDIDARTDVDGLFEAYRSALDAVAARHPATRVVPATAPLRHSAGGPGVWVREMLGRPNRSKLDNLARHRFNERVRRHWAGRPLFDLAAAEATGAAGRRETFRAGGMTCDNLRAAYTDDGGHLNAAGRRVAATAFVNALAAALRAERQPATGARTRPRPA